MRRGFKAQAERVAQEIRLEMGTNASSGLDATSLATHAGADVRRADELTSTSKLKALEALQPGAFSACTFHIGGRPVIVYSPLASHGRTQSDVAHEVSHILLGHDVQTVQAAGRSQLLHMRPGRGTGSELARWLYAATEEAITVGCEARAQRRRGRSKIRCKPTDGRVQDSGDGSAATASGNSKASP